MRPLAGIRVLVVDDNEDARDISKLGLEYDGAVVQVAATVAEAMAMVATIQPNVIVTDIKMPDTTGDIFLSQLKASTALRDIPVIALTGVQRDIDVGGFAEYFMKPISADVLTAAVVRAAAGRTDSG